MTAPRAARRALLPLLAVASVAACSPTPPATDADGWTASTPPAPVVEPKPQAPEPDSRMQRNIDAMLQRLSRARGLQLRHGVEGVELERREVTALLKAKAERDLPPGVLEAQGELLKSFDLIAADYDFVAGLYAIVESNVAGFYDQDKERMYLLDDLPPKAQAETLAHELQHALQDQHYDLKAKLKYRAGDMDRVTAAHALCEGDALASQFEVMMGSPYAIDAGTLRFAMAAAVAMSASGGKTPRLLQSALIAPYVDGLRLVRSLHERGGWAAVDAALAQPPESTEQLLHLDKLDAREPAIPVAEPVAPDASWSRMDADVFGEQGLRLAFEQWAINEVAAQAAAGWGGDRYAVFRRGDEHAVAWHLVFDDEAETDEAEALIRAHQAEACVKRGERGAIAWKRDGVHVVLARLSDCASATSWVDVVLAAR